MLDGFREVWWTLLVGVMVGDVIQVIMVIIMDAEVDEEEDIQEAILTWDLGLKEALATGSEIQMILLTPSIWVTVAMVAAQMMDVVMAEGILVSGNKMYGSNSCI